MFVPHVKFLISPLTSFLEKYWDLVCPISNLDLKKPQGFLVPIESIMLLVFVGHMKEGTQIDHRILT